MQKLYDTLIQLKQLQTLTLIIDHDTVLSDDTYNLGILASLHELIELDITYNLTCNDVDSIGKLKSL